MRQNFSTILSLCPMPRTLSLPKAPILVGISWSTLKSWPRSMELPIMVRIKSTQAPIRPPFRMTFSSPRNMINKKFGLLFVVICTINISCSKWKLWTLSLGFHSREQNGAYYFECTKTIGQGTKIIL